MPQAVPASAATNLRVWPFWLSICIQQLLFFAASGLRVPLVRVSTWVIVVPVLVIWALYFIAPLTSQRDGKSNSFLRAYALSGWVFVFGALLWDVLYFILGERYGIPVGNGPP